MALMDLKLADSSATETLGLALARSFPGAVLGPAVLHLRGELAAGKTTCVRALLRSLGVTGLVRSPTYTLVETYALNGLTCVHIDLYRLQAAIEVDALGLRDYLGPGCLLLIEWPEKGAQALPAADMDLALRYAGQGRSAQVSAKTTLGAEWLDNLGRDSSLAPYVTNLT